MTERAKHGQSEPNPVNSSPGRDDDHFPVFGYDQSRYLARKKIARAIALRGFFFHTFVRVETHGLEHIPASGGGLVMMNHRGGLDPIVMQGAVYPRALCVMSKIENFRIPAVNQMMRFWGCYPIRREIMDRRALDYTLRILRAGELALIAPEGHRANALQPAKEGIAFLAVKANAAVIPVAIRGTREAADCWRRLRPARITVTFGRAFRFRTDSPVNTVGTVENGTEGKTRSRRRDLALMTTESMYQLAALVDEAQRGAYSDLSKSTTDTLEFLT
jgi:1-acyl-sn-glycerol-3-phosphate acyltransferase